MTKAQIKKRILRAIPLLNDKYRPAFKGPHNRLWDASQCRVYGSGYYLQWDKGETRFGSVSLHNISKEDMQA